jgi:hypothetical protein
VAERYQVQTTTHTYTVVDDVETRYTALVTGRVLDDMDPSAPFPGALTVRGLTAGLDAHVKDGGLFAIAADVARVFSDPATAGIDVTLTFTAPGYHDTSLSVHVARDAALPVPANPVRMRRVAVQLQGRVVAARGSAPIADALVRLVDDPRRPAPAEHLVALRAPLATGHPENAVVRVFAGTGPGRQLQDAALAGALTLRLDDSTGLNAGNVLRIGLNAPVYVAIGQPAGAPGEVPLREPLRRPFLAGTPVQRVSPTPGVSHRRLMRRAYPGEGALVLDRALDADSVEIADPVEYQSVGALTDAQGMYRLESGGGMRIIHFSVRATRFRERVVPVTVDFGRAVNAVNTIELSP